jgi:hypothetical protein
MSVKFIARSALVGALLGAMACAPVIVTPLPQNVRRIAVLPPYQRDAAAERGSSADKDPVGLPNMTVGDVLAYQARLRLAEKGFEVLSPGAVKVVIKDRAPTSPQMAAQILREANLDAAGLYVEVRRWEPTPDSRGLKADGVIVALDVMLVDPKTGRILWQVNRPSRPVPVYGVVLTGQANVIVAETVMREVFASLGPIQPSA